MVNRDLEVDDRERFVHADETGRHRFDLFGERPDDAARADVVFTFDAGQQTADNATLLVNADVGQATDGRKDVDQFTGRFPIEDIVGHPGDPVSKIVVRDAVGHDEEFGRAERFNDRSGEVLAAGDRGWNMLPAHDHADIDRNSVAGVGEEVGFNVDRGHNITPAQMRQNTLKMHGYYFIYILLDD